MKIKQFLSKWSRTIHRWIGLYMAVIVAIYFVETIALPPTFSAGLPSVDGVPPAHAVAENSHAILSLEQATQVFISGHPEGINSLDDVDEIAYLPDSDIYRFENKQRCFEWYVDARTGEILKYGFNTNVFLEEKSLLGWLNPLIHELIELPFLVVLLTLAGSGVYLFISPFLVRKNLEIDQVVAVPGEN